MTSTSQDRISKLLAEAARAALTLMVVYTLGAFASQFARAQNFTTLYNFTNGTDGSSPLSGVAQDQSGNLYGTTPVGGPGGLGGYGVVYEVDTAGSETVLHTFAGPPSDGSAPSPPLLAMAMETFMGQLKAAARTTSASCTRSTPPATRPFSTTSRTRPQTAAFPLKA